MSERFRFWIHSDGQTEASGYWDMRADSPVEAAFGFARRTWKHGRRSWPMVLRYRWEGFDSVGEIEIGCEMVPRFLVERGPEDVPPEER